MKIHSSLLLLGLQAISLHASNTNTKTNVVAPASDIEKEVIENDKAIQGLGDLLIKKGLLSPWLEQMRDAQKALNDLDAKNKLGIREKAFKMGGDSILQCKEYKKSTANTPPQNDLLIAEINTLQAQREPLMQQIIAKKNADISELLALNDKIDAKNEEYWKKMSSEGEKRSGEFQKTQNEQESFANKVKSVPEYNALLKKLGALTSILNFVAHDGEHRKLNQSITDFLASNNEAKEYVAILSNPTGFENCTLDLYNFKQNTYDQYGSFIDNLSYIFSWQSKPKNTPK